MIAGRDVFRSADTRCWHRDDGALILSLEQPRPAITTDVLDALERAVAVAECDFATLVIVSSSEHFAFGANLDDAFDAAAAGRPDVLDRALDRYQRVMLRLRHATVPTVGAVRGVAVSGGCEVLMHCTRIVAHERSHIGLVEPSVGVIPGGGGLKEFARRASESGDPSQSVTSAFGTIAASTVAPTAADAQRLGFLTALDRVDAVNPLEEAIDVGRALHAAGYAPPPLNPLIRVAGPALSQRLRATQSALHRDGQLTAHQLEINTRVARVLCGGEGPGTSRSESDLLALERLHFLELATMRQTRERLEHLRRNGTALAN